MARYGMVIDLDRCTGCQSCVVACRAENNVPSAGPEMTEEHRAIFWMRVISSEEGEGTRRRIRFLPRPCMHCDDPPCVKVCPVRATYRNPEGLVGQVYARCIGCRYCTVACPYTARSFNWFAPEWPEEMRQSLNPDVPVRPKGVVEKCSFCVQRIRRVKERARREGRGIRDEELCRLPACAETCPAEAITFGDLDDPESLVSRLAGSPRAFRLLEELGTKPKVHYLAEARFDESR